MKTDKAVIIGFRLMQSVYSPLLKYYKELKKNDCDYYIGLLYLFIKDGSCACVNNNIDYFINYNRTYTINNVCKDIVKIHDKYIKDTGNTFFKALSKLLSCLLKDIEKL